MLFFDKNFGEWYIYLWYDIKGNMMLLNGGIIRVIMVGMYIIYN